MAPYNRKETKLPDLQDDDRTRRNEWLDFDEEKIVFPSPEEIDKMKLNIDFFDVDKFHKLNVDRISKLKHNKKKPEDDRFQYDINQLDDKLFGKLDEEYQQYNENPKFKNKQNNNPQADSEFRINPMYSSKGDNNSNDKYERPRNMQQEERKVYANTLK